MLCPMPTTPVQEWEEPWTPWEQGARCMGKLVCHRTAGFLQGGWAMQPWGTDLMDLTWRICHLRWGQACAPHQVAWIAKHKKRLLPRCMLLPTPSRTGKKWDCPWSLLKSLLYVRSRFQSCGWDNPNFRWYWTYTTLKVCPSWRLFNQS